MTVQHVRTAPVRRSPVRVPGRSEIGPAGAAPAPRLGTDRGSLCLVVPDIGEGDGVNLVRSLRRRESTRAVLLTRRSGRRELVVLLGGGVRGAVTAETPGAVRIAGRPPATPAPRAGAELTSRELGVLHLVAEGQTNRQIGERLDLSALTVKSHLARISRKIGTGDRAEMVAFAIRRSLLA